MGTDASEPLRIEEIRQLREENPGALFCPICSTVSEQFHDGGVGTKRKNAKCPTCGSLERHRLFWLHLFDQVWPHLPGGKKDVLHVAPEPFFAEILKPRQDVNYLSGDLFMPQAMMRLDLTDIQLWDSQFDLVICSHILEHIPDDRKAMREMYRILKPGGYLLVMVPTYGDTTYEDFSITSPEARREHFGQDDHVRKYGRDIMERLASVGFAVTDWPRGDDLPAAIRGFIACGKRIVFECRK